MEGGPREYCIPIALNAVDSTCVFVRTAKYTHLDFHLTQLICRFSILFVKLWKYCIYTTQFKLAFISLMTHNGTVSFIIQRHYRQKYAIKKQRHPYTSHFKPLHHFKGTGRIV